MFDPKNIDWKEYYDKGNGCSITIGTYYLDGKDKLYINNHAAFKTDDPNYLDNCIGTRNIVREAIIKGLEEQHRNAKDTIWNIYV